MKSRLSSGLSRLFNLDTLKVESINSKEDSQLSNIKISEITFSGINDTSFKANEWKQLETRLDSFKTKFEGLLENLKKDK